MFPFSWRSTDDHDRATNHNPIVHRLRPGEYRHEGRRRSGRGLPERQLEHVLWQRWMSASQLYVQWKWFCRRRVALREWSVYVGGCSFRATTSIFPNAIFNSSAVRITLRAERFSFTRDATFCARSFGDLGSTIEAVVLLKIEPNKMVNLTWAERGDCGGHRISY